MSVTVTIDGRKVEAQEGALLIDVCAQNGIDIPHFCYHPGLGPDGNCRMCQVEFVSERGNRLAVSCKAVVTDGMEVLTKSDAAKRARASVEEFLLLNHPLDCPICDKSGECSLQNYYMEHDLENSRMDFTRFRKKKAKEIGPTLVLDQERCVLCDRCVRFLRDVADDEQLFIAGRGHEAYITTFPGQEVTSPYSINTVDLCPVGALTAKDFRFSTPSWYLKNTPSVCTTCARGCTMQIQVEKDQIKRMRPLHNPHVNGYWACDEGRLNYKFVNENRIHRPFVRRTEEVYECSRVEALTELQKLLGTGSTPTVVLASASCTLEELYLAKRLSSEINDASAFVARHVPDGVDDHLLRRADKHANAHGAELLGLNVLDLQSGDDAAAVPLKDVLGKDGVLLCVGFNADVPASLLAVAASARKVISLSGCVTQLTERADLVVPGLTFAEKDGLVVNFDGHIQRLRPAFDARGESEWRILDALSASIRGIESTEFVSTLRKEISEKEAAFTNVKLANIGPLGAPVSMQAVG